eukprot:698242-Pyramimonas_sp.AAC.1
MSNDVKCDWSLLKLRVGAPLRREWRAISSRNRTPTRKRPSNSIKLASCHELSRAAGDLASAQAKP